MTHESIDSNIQRKIFNKRFNKGFTNCKGKIKFFFILITKHISN